MAEEVDIIDQVVGQEYKYGFTTNIEMDTAPMGLTEDTIRFISAKK
jgi:Fe-S cluster assembly protein SufB